MTTPPENWQDEARAEIERVAQRWLTLSVFVQFLRIALAEDDYQEYQEALSWFQKEETEALGKKGEAVKPHGAWILDREDDDTYTLFAPNGNCLFNVSRPTLWMLSRMFMNEAKDARIPEDLREAPFG